MDKNLLSCTLKSILLICIASVTFDVMAKPDPTVALRTKYASLQEQLQNNQFKLPLVIDSAETPNRLTGDIYAVANYPFSAVSAGLNNPDHWCDVMILHINTKYCHASVGPSGTKLSVNIGKKTPQELADAARVEFNYSAAAVTTSYIQIVLNAKDGPMGTSDLRILLEAVELSNNKTFLHLTYSYATNFSSRLALRTYLATIGRGKVGFTVVGKQDDSKPAYIGGMRGLMERNTMRYYLAIDAFLEAAGAAPAVQFERRSQSWYTAAERFPRQLHEIDRSAYLEMKRAEYLRQQKVH